MRCLIIDDEPLALTLLEENIKLVGRLQLVASCRSAIQAIKILDEEPVDVIFCDIKMPLVNGLQLIRGLQQKPMVVFITAHQEFAFESFDLDVVDYLLKPVPFERFLRACNKVFSFYEAQRLRNYEVSHTAVKDHLFVYADYSMIKLSHNEITHIEGLGDYVKLHVKGEARPLLSRVSIKALMEQLPTNQFFRTHKSYIVNLSHVRSIRNGRIKVDGTDIPYSENYKEVIGRMTGKVI
jgi:DNA-binding LytR/AlgR family response regulator